MPGNYKISMQLNENFPFYYSLQLMVYFNRLHYKSDLKKIITQGPHIMLIDSHTHFDLILEDKTVNENDLLKGLRYSNIEYSVQISIDSSGLEWSRKFAEKNSEYGILYTAGIHPSSPASGANLNELENFVQKVMKSSQSHLLIGIGECGLDYYRLRQPKEAQIKSFERQIDLAEKYSLPLIIHLRDAMEDGLEILKRKKVSSGIMHCFAGGADDAKRALDLGLMISFAGNVTYKNAHELHESAKYVPGDMLLLETDAPFLAPVPLRGKPNRPDNIKHTYKFVSNLRKETTSRLEEAITGNFKKLIKK